MTKMVQRYIGERMDYESMYFLPFASRNNGIERGYISFH
jgi:hypothetical protein